MKITNKSGLPMPIVKAVENDPYDNFGTMSVTTLIKPPQAAFIGKDREGEIEEDAADRIWSLVGQVGHTILERAAGLLDPELWISERRYIADIDGETVSAKVDCIDVAGREVQDYKFTSGWAVINAREGKTEWNEQLSVQAYLARRGLWLNEETGERVQGPSVEIERGKIIAIVRDWTKSQALRVRDWPAQQVEAVPIDIMSDADTEAWLRRKIVEYKEAMGGSPRSCTDEERWHKPGKWAVKKAGAQKAAKLADTEDELSSWIFANRSKLGANYEIEQRPAEYRRCADYCSAAPFCKQFQQSLAPDHALERAPDGSNDGSYERYEK